MAHAWRSTGPAKTPASFAEPTAKCRLPPMVVRFSPPLTYGPVSIGVHLLSHAQRLCGGDVHIAGDHHQVDGLLLKDVLPDELLALRENESV